jgi:hypothetical protein
MNVHEIKICSLCILLCLCILCHGSHNESGLPTSWPTEEMSAYINWIPVIDKKTENLSLVGQLFAPTVHGSHPLNFYH